jgi:Domain of unknown function (DUF2017)
MQITRPDRHTVALTQLNSVCCELLRQIVSSADPGESGPARARIFPTPTEGREPEADRDWREYVEPDLRRLFQDALDVVAEDVKGLAPEGRKQAHALRIPVKNLEAWIHALNQARLAIVARNDFAEKDMEGRAPIEGDARALALFQVHFYGFLQECFLQHLP